MILTPSHLRPRAHKLDYSEVASKEALSVRVDSFCFRLGQSLARLLSPEIWTNAPFLIYVFTNGVAAAGVVIPWTFAYDYIRSKWLLGIEADSAVGLLAETQLAWYPSLIGLGSCAGQVLFGFIISKTHHPSGCTARSRRSFSRSNLTLIFTIVLLLNGVMTLGFTYAPTPSSVDYGGEGFIFLTTAGRVFAVICFFLGVTDGAFMTIMGPMLEYLLEEINFPAGLGISLCITGAFNLAGTLAGGSMLDLSGSYYSANLLAACLSLSGFSVLLVCCLVFRKEQEMGIGDEDTSERL
ncbi:unnamed protein product [Mesocestoides corti]|nr:unnamed protein product [Mesocestoides corti]